MKTSFLNLYFTCKTIRASKYFLSRRCYEPTLATDSDEQEINSVNYKHNTNILYSWTSVAQILMAISNLLLSP